MTPTVKSREYDGSRRRQASTERRARILAAARAAFVERGYAGATMADIAARADVALDTVYELAGRKPALFRLLIETAISGRDEAVTAEDRDYVRQIHTADSAAAKLTIYASAVRAIHERLAPLFAVLQTAATSDATLADLWTEVSSRRARNMRLFAAELASTGRLRVPVDEAADVIWATNSPEMYLLLVDQRGWSPDRYEEWLAAAWQRLLIE